MLNALNFAEKYFKLKKLADDLRMCKITIKLPPKYRSRLEINLTALGQLFIWKIDLLQKVANSSSHIRFNSTSM